MMSIRGSAVGVAADGEALRPMEDRQDLGASQAGHQPTDSEEHPSALREEAHCGWWVQRMLLFFLVWYC